MALLAFGESLSESGEPESQEDVKERGEYRCYRLQPHALRAEAELVDRYAAPDFTAALDGIYCDLLVTSALLKGHNVEEDFDGFTLILLGQHLERLIQPLNKACSLLADCKLVQAARLV